MSFLGLGGDDQQDRRRAEETRVKVYDLDARLNRIEKLLEIINLRLATSRWSPKDDEPDSR